MSGDKIEVKLKKIEEEMFQFDNNFSSLMKGASKDYKTLDKLAYIHSGIKALYLQNQVLIEQQKEMINYMDNHAEDKK